MVVATQWMLLGPDTVDTVTLVSLLQGHFGSWVCRIVSVLPLTNEQAIIYALCVDIYAW